MSGFEDSARPTKLRTKTAVANAIIEHVWTVAKLLAAESYNHCGTAGVAIRWAGEVYPAQFPQPVRQPCPFGVAKMNNAAPAQVFQEAYFSFVADINSRSVSNLLQTCQDAIRLGYDRLHLLIQSGGGSVKDGLFAFNYLNNLPIELVTYNDGSVESIAVLLYLAGKIRKCGPVSRFMLHQSVTNFDHPVSTDVLIAEADATKKHDDLTLAILQGFINMPPENWVAYERRSNLFIYTADALKFGIATMPGHFCPPLRGHAIAVNPGP